MNRILPPVVVFDIGNVLVDWDPAYLYVHLFPGRPDAMAWFLDTICTAAWNLEQDAGRTWADGVGALVSRFPEWRAEIEAYDRRWHEMIPREIEGSVALLQQLKTNGVPVYAITNYSSEKYAESFARFPFFALFDGVIVSGNERLLKPHAPIFGLLCSRYGLVPDQCIFIDDKLDNVLGARQAGMKAIHFKGADLLPAALRACGVPV
jgi:2-haloacid dehalogenase